jgi:copper(I)-binding protein
MTQFRIAMLVIALITAGSVPAGAEALVFHDFWVAETPPGAMATAAFVRIKNNGQAGASVTGATSSACERIEFHSTETTDGVAKMIRQSELVVPVGGEITLEPGGTHMMLIRPTALHAGERVSFTFTLGDGTRVTKEADVRRRGGPRGEHPH